MAMRSPDAPFLASFHESTHTQVSSVGTDVVEDSVIFTTGSNNSNNSDDLLGMCNIVEETECGPVWAMICFDVIGGLIVALNVMHVLAVMATPQIRKSANAKGLFNLAAADLIYGCTIIISYNCPFTKLTRLRKYLPLCATLFASTTGLLALSGGTLVLMSMERCIIICVPFVNRQKTNKVFKTLLTMIWVIDFSCCFGLTWKNLQDQLTGTTDLFCFYGLGACGLRWSGDGLYQGIAIYGTVITFILTMLFANIAIIIRVQKSKKFRTKAAGAVSSRNIKTAQIVGVMCLCYSFCWCCIFLWLGFRILKPEYVRPWHSHLSLMIVTSNSMMNPLIYGLASPEYRSTIRNMFRRGWRKAVDMAVASADLTSSDNHDRRNEAAFVNPNPRPSTSSDTRFEKEVVSVRSVTDNRGVTDKPAYQREEEVNNKGCDELTLTAGSTSKANTDTTAPVAVKEHESEDGDSTTVAAKKGSGNNNLDLAIEWQEPVNNLNETLTTKDVSENLKCGKIDGVYNIGYYVDITINSKDETTTL